MYKNYKKYYKGCYKSDLSSRSWALLIHKANTMINKIESVPFKETNNKTISAILDNSNFFLVRQKLGILISLYGTAALGLLPTNNGLRVVALRISYSQTFGTDTYCLTGESGLTYPFLYDSTNYELPIQVEYRFEKNYVIVRSFVSTICEDGSKKITKIIQEKEYPFNVLPVQVFRNNLDCVPDFIEAGTSQEFDNLNAIGNDLIKQYNLSKNHLYVSADGATIDSPADLAKKIAEEGQDYIDAFDSDSVISQGAGVAIISSKDGIMINSAATTFIEDNIKRMLGINSDDLTDEKGTNKHNLEIGLKGIYFKEQLDRKRQAREIEYNKFFALLALYTNTKKINVKLQQSNMEQIKEQFLKASVAKVEADAKAVANSTKAIGQGVNSDAAKV